MDGWIEGRQSAVNRANRLRQFYRKPFRYGNKPISDSRFPANPHLPDTQQCVQDSHPPDKEQKQHREYMRVRYPSFADNNCPGRIDRGNKGPEPPKSV